MLPFTYALGFLTVFHTIALVAAVMTYLVVSQQNTIDEIHRSLYAICLKYISEQNFTIDWIYHMKFKSLGLY